MKRSRIRPMVVLALSLTIALPSAALLAADGEQPEQDWKSLKKDSKRQKIDAVADETLKVVFAKNDKAESLFDKAHGWAVFDNLKLAFFFSGGGGAGVAVERASGKRTYMKMGTGGIGLGLGGHRYQVVFLFQDEATFDNFVDNGWKANASGTAAAGTEGAGGQVGFVNGIAMYQLTEAGLMANVDVTGTRYWRDKKLNR